MSKKPAFSITKEQRLLQAKQELEQEEKIENKSTTLVSTTFLIESALLYSIKEIALKRKKLGIKPNTVTGIIKESLKAVVSKEKEYS